MIKTIHAVLADTALIRIVPSGEIVSTPIHTLPRTPEQLCDFVLEHKLTHLWIDFTLEIEKVNYQLSQKWLVSTNWLYTDFEEEMRRGHNILASMHGKQKEGNITSWYFNILFRKQCSFDTLNKLSPVDMLRAVRDLEALIDVPVTTAGGTGWRSFEHHNFKNKRAVWLQESKQDLAEIEYE